MSQTEVVIVGVAGRFPGAVDKDELWQGLMDGKDFTTCDDLRWPRDQYPSVTHRKGTIPEKCVSAFDASYFGISALEADYMDPTQRMLLEVTREAIVDASLRPEDLSKRKVGVFVAVTRSDAEALLNDERTEISKYVIRGSTTSMLASRLCSCYNFKGPCRIINADSASSIVAIHDARMSLLRGECDFALVGGVNLLLRPGISQGSGEMRILSEQGQCGLFDRDGEGFARSDAVIACLLTRTNATESSTFPLYASIVGSGVLQGEYQEEGNLCPNIESQVQLLREIYSANNVDREEVSYVEACAAGTVEADTLELSALNSFFCNDKDDNLSQRPKTVIGSIKTNMGHCEAASGLMSIVKICMCYKNESLPYSPHYQSSRSLLKNFVKSKFDVNTKNITWDGGLSCINSFGLGGICAHIVMLGGQHKTVKASSIVQDSLLPACTIFSSRTEKGLQSLAKFLAENYAKSPIPLCLSSTASHVCRDHPYRGFYMKSNDPTSDNYLTMNAIFDGPKEIWWIFSGVGSHWSKMGTSLMSHATFRHAVLQCEAILNDNGLRIDDDNTNLSKIIEVGIDSSHNFLIAVLSHVTIQIGLVHMLKLGRVPMTCCVGHSIGEFAAAYASDHLTLSQAVRLVYYLGVSCREDDEPVGAMAATGLTWTALCEEIHASSLDKVWPACHNGTQSTAVAGEPEQIDKFVDVLKEKGQFARVIDSFGIAFHSPFVEKALGLFESHAAPIFGDKLIQRSNTWKRSCVLDTMHDHVVNEKLFVQNLLEPVRFCEAILKASAGTVMIEIAPHALLRTAIQATNNEVKYIHLQKKGNDPLHELLQQVGLAYVNGINVNYELITRPMPHQAEENCKHSTIESNCSGKEIPSYIQHAWDHLRVFHVPVVRNRKNLLPNESLAIGNCDTELNKKNASTENTQCEITTVTNAGFKASGNSFCSGSIHTSSVVHPSASIHPSVTIGPFCVIGSGVHINAGTMIASHSVIDDHSIIGSKCRIGRNVVIDVASTLGDTNIVENSVTVTGNTSIGNDNILYAGTVFGTRGEWNSDMVPSGKVIVGNGNRIRENTVVHRPFTRAETRIGNSCYIMHNVTIAHDAFVDDCVQIAHNCVIAGYCNIFRGCFLGMQSSFHQFSTVGAYSMVSMNSRVTRDVPPLCTFHNNECIQINSHGLIKNHGYTESDIAELRAYFQNEWPEISFQTKTVFKGDIETFFRCRKVNNSKRSIAPIKFAEPFSTSNLHVSKEEDIATRRIDAELRQLLHIPHSQNISDSIEFETLGLDSLVSASLASALSIFFSVDISVVDIADNNTIIKLSKFITEKCRTLSSRSRADSGRTELDGDTQPASIFSSRKGSEIELGVLDLLRTTLHFDSSWNITPSTEFEKIGLDSIAVVSLAAELSQHFAMNITASDISTHNTLMKLGDYISSFSSANTNT